jgi:hypothetical protein
MESYSPYMQKFFNRSDYNDLLKYYKLYQRSEVLINWLKQRYFNGIFKDNFNVFLDNDKKQKRIFDYIDKNTPKGFRQNYGLINMIKLSIIVKNTHEAMKLQKIIDNKQFDLLVKTDDKDLEFPFIGKNVFSNEYFIIYRECQINCEIETYILKTAVKS